MKFIVKVEIIHDLKAFQEINQYYYKIIFSKSVQSNFIIPAL